MNRGKFFCHALLSATLILGTTLSALAQGGDYFSNLPKGATPEEVGKKLADHFVTGPTAPSPRLPTPQMANLPSYMRTIGYAEIGTWYGALNFAQLTKDEALQKQLIARFDPLIDRKSVV